MAADNFTGSLRPELIEVAVSCPGVTGQEIGNLHRTGGRAGKQPPLTWVCSGSLGGGGGERPTEHTEHHGSGCHAKMAVER